MGKDAGVDENDPLLLRALEAQQKAIYPVADPSKLENELGVVARHAGGNLRLYGSPLKDQTGMAPTKTKSSCHFRK
jgi:hypothetical protein